MKERHQHIALALLAGTLASCEKSVESEVAAGPQEDGMVRIEGGISAMGSSGSFETPFGHKEFPEERPVRELEVSGFWIDVTEVTNKQFAAFVDATGYVTFAEREADLSDFPPGSEAALPKQPFNQGSMVFTPPEKFEGDPNTPGAYLSWWRWDPEASWRHPLGKNSTIKGKEDHPVVCVTKEDATAYAEWSGKRLPTEAEWEFAARGGLKGKTYCWGDELRPNDQWMANTYHGEFPTNDIPEDGFVGSSPVKSFPPNDFGLYDVAGNAWELCSDFYDPDYPSNCEKCDPKGPETWVNRGNGRKSDGAPQNVIKGGSFLCHVSYCMRYRPAARHSLESDSPANHVGFRCVKDL